MAKIKITTDEVAKIAKLANLTLSSDEVDLFADQFTAMIDVINQLNELDTSKFPPTSSVSHLTNITRADEVDESRVLTQQQALSGAKRKHNGFFVVDQILTKND